MKIAVLLSGGVDSSVALRRLMDQGHRDITAYYLKIWLEDELSYLGDCPWEEDLAFARGVCDQAGVPLKVLPLQTEYFDRVVQYALEELKAGHTPSPDIFCNQRVKFGAFFEKVQESYDLVATGHYAQIRQDPAGTFRLFRAPDPVKDQSYFLSHLSQSQVSKITFPIGDLYKTQVRELAGQYNLVNQARKDSQGICFLGKIKYNDFVGFYLGRKPGPIIQRETGKTLGTHQGYWYHTIGQRTGLGLGNGPWYVVAKDVVDNIIYVSHQEHQAQQERSDFLLINPNWIAGAPEPSDILQGKLRHGPQLIPLKLQQETPDRYRVHLEASDRGIAPGQFCVVYRDQECLGGGMISL